MSTKKWEQKLLVALPFFALFYLTFLAASPTPYDTFYPFFENILRTYQATQFLNGCMFPKTLAYLKEQRIRHKDVAKTT